MSKHVLLLLGLLSLSRALDNGLARMPPRGWRSWQRFRCNTNCQADPENCISEHLFKVMADRLVEDNFVDRFTKTGYTYVLIDDCWSDMDRDSEARLQADPQRFPGGIKALADYMHARDLKIGIYGDIGQKTCSGYPGSRDHMKTDAETFAEWGVDMVYMDGCSATMAELDTGFPAMSEYLNKTGRPMVFSCGWPKYEVIRGKTPDYRRVAHYCNTWTPYLDVEDSWDSVKRAFSFYANNSGSFIEVSGPGAWNDMGALVIGNYGLSFDQQKTQMSLWTIMSSPMFMSADLRKISPQSVELLQNNWMTSIIEQMGYMGLPGRRIKKMGDVEIWVKHLAPGGATTTYAFINLADVGGPAKVDIQFQDMGLHQYAYNVTEVFNRHFVSVKRPHDWLNVTVNPTGVYMGMALFDP